MVTTVSHGSGMPDIVNDMIARAAADNGMSADAWRATLRQTGTARNGIRNIGPCNINLSDKEQTIITLLRTK